MQQKRFFWLVPQSDVNTYCGFCTAKAKSINKNMSQGTLSHVTYNEFPSVSYGTSEAVMQHVNSPSMASGDTVCVAIGEGSTYCIPSRGPLVAMPTPRPEEINQLVSQSVSIYYHLLPCHAMPNYQYGYHVVW